MENITVRRVDPTQEDLRYFDGPWRNDACMGYAVMAMERSGLGIVTIRKVMSAMVWCFDDTTVEEAAQHYMRSPRPDMSEGGRNG